MPLDCILDQQRMRLSISGEIDHHRASTLMRELEQEIDLAAPQLLELNMKGVTFMDSSGIALLLKAHRMLALTGGKLRVTQVPPQPAKVLRSAGLERMIAMTFL